MDWNSMVQRTPFRNPKYRLCWILLIGIIGFQLYVWRLLDSDCQLNYIRQLMKNECVHINTTIKTDIADAKTKPWKTNKPKPIITLFTTFDIEMQQLIVFENILINWKRLKYVETILFYDNEKTKLLGQKFHWTLLPVPKHTCGTPVLRSMFEAAQNAFESHFYGYANADILFSSDLKLTLDSVLKSMDFDKGSVILTGRRIEVNISAVEHRNVHSDKDLADLAKHGNLSYDMAADYFITNNLFLWKYVPDLVVGRPIIDNWLIWYARITNSKIIDSTFTVLAIHQKANGSVKKVNFCNQKVAKKAGMLPLVPIWRGSILCSQYSSIVTPKKDIIFVRKSLLPEKCNWRKITYE